MAKQKKKKSVKSKCVKEFWLFGSIANDKSKKGHEHFRVATAVEKMLNIYNTNSSIESISLSSFFADFK